MFEAKIYLLPIVGYAVRGESYAGHHAMASYRVQCKMTRCFPLVPAALEP